MKMNFKLIIISFIASIILSPRVTSQIDTTFYIKNPDRYVAEQLINKRIVMLGDYMHSAAISYFATLNVLNEWLEIINNNNEKSSLTLILECSHKDADVINYFIRTGNTDSFYYMIVHNAHIEELEFFTGLKYFTQNLENSKAFKENRITFKVEGFEQFALDSIPEWFNKLTERERDLWFVNVRDSFSSSGIINYLSTNPEEHALIYYGSGHLIKDYINKDFGTYILKGDSSKGYFMAHYLKDFFGDENVLTVNQMGNPAAYYNDDKFAITTRFEVYVKSSDIPWSDYYPESYDAFILRRNYLYFYQHYLSLIPTRYTIENGFKDKDTSFSINFFNAHFDFFLGKHFKNISELESWYNNNKDSISLNIFDSPQFAKSIFHYYWEDTSSIGKKINYIDMVLDLPNYIPHLIH